MCEQNLKKTAPQYNSNSVNNRNIAGQVLKSNPKLYEKREVLYVTSRSIEQRQPKHIQNHLKKLRN